MKHAVLAAVLIAVPLSAHATPLLGVNMGGLDESGTYPAISVPQPPFAADMPGPIGVMRIPFKLSEMYPNGPTGAMLTGYVNSLLDMVHWCLTSGIQPIVDDHEYAFLDAGKTDITTTAGQAEFAAEWVALAKLLPAGTAIDLTNEPHTQTNAALVPVYNATIAALRSAGFKGTIFVEPTGWARAAQVTATWADFNGIVDPLKNTDLEVHWYLDPSDNGQGGDPTSATAAATVMQGVVAYQASGKSPFGKVLLGETGVAQSGNVVDAIQTAALRNELAVIQANPSAFYGVTLWAAGPEFAASYPLAEKTATNAGYLIAEQALTAPLTVYLSEDAYQGDAAATVTVDGVKAWAGNVTASRFGQPQAVPILLSYALAAGTHTVTVAFSNDAWGGTVTTDRNLFVGGSTWNGANASADCFGALYSNGSFTCHAIVP